MASRTARSILVLAAGLWTIIGPTSGSASSQVRPGSPSAQEREETSRSDANYVRLDVFASRGAMPATDLTAADFEVLEDNAPQRIESFELVAPAPGDAAGSKARVFVLFLDAPHLSPAGAERLTTTIADALDKVIGPEDLIAVMTPEMSATNLAFEKKTIGIRDMLGKYWAPDGAVDLSKRDTLEVEYEKCFPPAEGQTISPTAQEMIDRRRERQTLDALIDLIKHLTTARSERKAVLVFSEGWPRLKANVSLVGRTEGTTAPPPKVGPGGKPLPGFNPRDPNSASLFRCEADRLHLAQVDNNRGFQWLMDEANNANASFYPVDPRQQNVPPRPAAYADSTRELAAATDGAALTGGPQLSADLQRTASDLSSYYLMGYYSSNTRRDGSFRKVSVRAKKDGVTARTRRGYRAPRDEETSFRDRPSAVAPAVATSRSATPEALGKLVEYRSDEAFRVQAIAGISAAAPRQIWVLGEIAYRMAQTSDWRNGAVAMVIVSSDSETLSKQEITIEPGERTFLASVEAPADPGAYLVQVQLVAANSGGGQKTLADAERVTISARAGPDSPQIQQALLFRRGPSTGPSYLPTADVRFRRNESIRVAAPVASTATAPSIRLLGRNGSVIDVPIEASIADAPSPDATSVPGSSWLVGQTRLAPLAAGEYVLELRVDVEGDPHKVQVPLRVIP